MPKKKYNVSEKRKLSFISQTDWDRRLEILTLRNQGWTYQSIGDKLGITKPAVYQTYNKTKDMTIEDIKQLMKILDERQNTSGN